MTKITFLMLIISLSLSSLLHAKMQIIPLHKTQGGHLEIEASINQVKGKFILDTGATGTVINTNKLGAFGITKGQEKIDGIRIGSEETGKIATFPIEITQFSIGQTQLKITSIYSNDNSWKHAPDVMGIIGYDAIFELNALLDVQQSQLLIPENKTDIETLLGNSNSPQYKMIGLHKSPMGFNFVDAKLGANSVRLLVDTGAPGVFLDESVLIQFGLQLETHPTAKTIIEEGLELPVKIYRQGQIQIGGEVLMDDFFTTDFSALMKAVNVDGQFKLIGVLGNKHLAQLSSIIDLANAKLYIKKS